MAVLSEGHMRDAISILERCAGEQKGLIDDDYVRDLVGIPKMDQIYSIVNAIIEQTAKAVTLAKFLKFSTSPKVGKLN